MEILRNARKIDEFVYLNIEDLPNYKKKWSQENHETFVSEFRHFQNGQQNWFYHPPDKTARTTPSKKLANGGPCLNQRL